MLRKQFACKFDRDINKIVQRLPLGMALYYVGLINASILVQIWSVLQLLNVKLVIVRSLSVARLTLHMVE
jgi:hypothetical protein